MYFFLKLLKNAPQCACRHNNIRDNPHFTLSFCGFFIKIMASFILRGIFMESDKELNYHLFLHRDEDFKRTNIKSEFSRYNDIKYGNVEKVKESIEYIKKNFYKGKGTLSDNLLHNNIYHMVIAVGVVSRVCIDAGMSEEESYTLSDIYIRRADQCKNPQDVIDLSCEMQLDYATRMHNLRKTPAISYHIRNSIDFIYDHLHLPLTMEQVAENENLNPSYFSKLFVKETGITAKAFIIDAKMKTAKNMLLYSEGTLFNIAMALGFSSQSAFSAAFKKHTGITPGEFRDRENYKDIFL